MRFTAPDWRAGVSFEGGVRPALRCPSSVRSRNASRASCSASARFVGSTFLPVAVTTALERPVDFGFLDAMVNPTGESWCVLPFSDDRGADAGAALRTVAQRES